MRFASLLGAIENLNGRSRLFIAIGVAVLVFLLLPSSTHLISRFLASWIAGVVCFLTLIGIMMSRATPQKTRNRAARTRANPLTVLTFVVAAALASLLAIWIMLSNVKGLSPAALSRRIALSGLTIFCSWLLTHTSFALNYARFYYDDDSVFKQEEGYAGGLDFPGERPPDYWDFMYFAFTISMTSQTSDVSITSRYLRRLVLVQELVAFFFYSVIIASSVNLIAGLV